MNNRDTIFLGLILFFLSCFSTETQAQKIYQFDRGDVNYLFFTPSHSHYLPHLVRMYQRSYLLHNQIWNNDTTGLRYVQDTPSFYLTDWEDDGNAGVCAIPKTTIQIGVSPINNSFFISPTIERYAHLNNHEFTHVVMSDKYNTSDLHWRKFIGAKVIPDSRYPISALWSYLTTPRWYSPRWYHEGIACFMETWLAGGVGRALGGYDEMYFRSIINENHLPFSVVGLETEGTTQDFQVGANSYLYGTRFVNYLAFRNGMDTLVSFYNRTDGSRKFFGSQFKKVYGEKLSDVWEEWIKYENNFQRSNLDVIAQYPITPTTPLSNKPLGSVSSPVLDSKRGVIYVAVNYPGDFAHIESIDILTAKRKKLFYVDGPMLHQTAYLAYDHNHDRLFVSTNNGGYRGMKVYDMKKKRLIEEQKYTRVSELVYDNANDRLFGIFTNLGISHIIYYDTDLKQTNILYSFPFGQSVSDLSVSHDGKNLSLTIFGLKGDQTLAMFDVAKLLSADFSYREIMKLDDSNLGQFRFSLDDTHLIGSSYYTGVSNIWDIDIATQNFTLLSNTTTGLFSPLQFKPDSLIALSFGRNGMTPVKMGIEEVKDANAIEYLGQKVFERNPSLETISEIRDSSLLTIKFSEVYDSISRYKPIKELRFTGAYPDISGFTDTASVFNSVTPVLGYRFVFQDRIGLNRLNLYIGISPWSANPWKNRFHASLEWNIGGWKLDAYYNSTSFYDLFGPFRTSRNGYKVGLSYNWNNSLRRPYSWGWSAGISTFGMMDKLPLFQNVDIDKGVTSLQTAFASINVSKLRTSLGGVMPEQGYKLSFDAYTYFAQKKFYPSAALQFDTGFLIPFMRNTSFWLRTAVGQSFGDLNSAFGNDYFGGFRNNYVDYRDSYRYRDINSMPGARIDQIKAHCFAKFTGELNFRPIRFNNFGFLGFYPTYAQFSIFSTDLVANPWGYVAKNFSNFVNIGAQLNIEVVLFSYLKTTWSVGYAHIFPAGGHHDPTTTSRGEWMFSLKLL